MHELTAARDLINDTHAVHEQILLLSLSLLLSSSRQYINDK